ncbi:unnamed protein product [Prorocentrum cordatum]|uniref:Uncharacterized protein n=1 Tax=Prorocentrum cordatum TaxID=2364126 RepID=A0ABN9SDM6_9DINO|nr:unnamed protein product [Polarella glacialis]
MTGRRARGARCAKSGVHACTVGSQDECCYGDAHSDACILQCVHSDARSQVTRTVCYVTMLWHLGDSWVMVGWLVHMRRLMLETRRPLGRGNTPGADGLSKYPIQPADVRGPACAGNTNAV